MKYITILAQFFSNYDLTDNKSGPGQGIYSQMDKYKSVSEFRNKRLNKRKKLIKKILDSKPE